MYFFLFFLDFLRGIGEGEYSFGELGRFGAMLRFDLSSTRAFLEEDDIEVGEASKMVLVRRARR